MKSAITMHNDSQDDDEDLFRKEMAGVKPLKPDARHHHRPKPGSIRVSRQADLAPIADVFSDAPLAEDCPEQLSFSRNGIQPATLKKLRQGKLAIEDEIDLHGMTVDDARNYLRSFLAECEATGTRVIRIVHGKGYRSKDRKPLIKGMVNRWLRELPMVLAFYSAIPADGGNGAVYVLLKR
jgi:DNA-nicking Smr family endonuclease